MISYFDDFGAMLPEQLARMGLATFTRWCELLGIGLKLKKSEGCEKITSLGLLGTFPNSGYRQKLQAALTTEKATRWPHGILGHISTGFLSSHELGELTGKLCFSQTCLFGEFARAHLRCLYRKLRARRYCAALSKFETMSLRWWADVISRLQPRTPWGSGKGPDYVLYTDAATSSGRIAALLLKGNKLPPIVLILAVARAPNFWMSRFNAQNRIFGMEMLAPLASIWMNRKKLTCASINLYIDNDNVLTSLVRGGSSCDIISATVACFWRISEARSIDIWIGRVPSKKNPADIPARQAHIPFPVNKRVGLENYSIPYNCP